MSLEELIHSDSELVITDLVIQKKDHTRVSVFINEIFAFGIAYSTYEEYHLQKEMILSREKIQQILVFEEINKAKIDALNFIAKKMRTKWEIRSRLQKKGFSNEIIDKIIIDFCEHKYIDDADYAETFVRDFLKFKKDGIFKIRQKLGEKRINQQLIDDAIAKYVSKDEQYEKALNLSTRKLSSIQNKDNKKEKIYRFLSQKGFEREIISRVLDKIFIDG